MGHRGTTGQRGENDRCTNCAGLDEATSRGNALTRGGGGFLFGPMIEMFHKLAAFAMGKWLFAFEYYAI